MTRDAALGLALAAGLAALAFVTTGGNNLAPNTWSEIALTLLGAAAAIALLSFGPPARPWGVVSVALFAATAALTAGSIGWSVRPDLAWAEAGRTAAYVAVFGAGAVFARLAPGRWRALLGGLGLACTVLAGWALLAKVFPATLDPGETFGRLREPFGYWNATGLIGAVGLPACLWAGARMDRGRVTRGLAIPALAILLSVIVLSFSRGALLVAVIGLAFWFATAPVRLRLRGAVVLACGALGAAVIAGYALATDPLSHDLVPLPARTTAGHSFGVLLALLLPALSAAGVLVAFAIDRAAVPPRVHRAFVVALLGLVALIPAAGVAALASSSRGLTGEISHLWSTVTSTNSGAPNTPGRLVQLGNSRGRYWSEAFKVGEHHLLLGAGAGGYRTAVVRYRNDPRVVDQAHSYVLQTFSDLGLVGVALMLALLAAWGLAVRRTLAAPVARQDPAERAAHLTLLATVIVFGVHSAVDWTWFIPGTAVPALLCAGWLAGRGPLAAGGGPREPRRRFATSPGRSAAAIGIAGAALLCAWAIWQPLRSANADAAAVAALSRGDAGTALVDARSAASIDPVAVEPLWEEAAIYQAAGEFGAARAALVEATRRQPDYAASWLALGEFELGRQRPAAAIGPLQRAVALDQTSTDAAAFLAEARAVVAQGHGG